MRIYHNIPALTAYNALNHTSNALQKTIQKLSTGLRINSASDDAAGLAISEKMRAQISGLEMAQRNAQDGISMLQTAEGAIQSTQSILQRMRELAVQASNDTLTAEDRSYIQLEVGELKNEVERIAHTTQFNGKRLLDGSSAGVVSSSNLNVKAYVRGSLREIDQFGQKKSFEGNYKIQIKASGAGQGEAQKSAIMVIKHPNVITDVNVNVAAGVEKVSVDNVPAGNYTVKTVASTTYEAAIGTGNFTGISLDGGTTANGYVITGGTVPQGYQLTSVGAPKFEGVGERSMRVSITNYANDGTPTVKSYEIAFNSDLTEGGTKSDSDALTALVDKLNKIGQGIEQDASGNTVAAGYKFKANVDPGTGKIMLTADDANGMIELKEITTAAQDERTGIEYIMGDDSETKSLAVLTGNAAHTPWGGEAAQTASFKVKVAGGTTLNTAQEITINANDSTTVEELYKAINKKLQEMGVTEDELKATMSGEGRIQLVSKTGKIELVGGTPSATNIDGFAKIFGTANASTTMLTGGDAHESYNFSDPEDVLKGTKMLVTVDEGGTPKNAVVELKDAIHNIGELEATLDEQLKGLGVDAVQVDLGQGVMGIRLISDKKITLADGTATQDPNDATNLMTPDAIKKIFGYALPGTGSPIDPGATFTTTATKATLTATTAKAMTYEDLLPTINESNPKKLSMKVGDGAAFTVTIDKSLANVEELKDYLNQEDKLATKDVLATVEDGKLKFISAKKLSIVNGPTNPTDTMLLGLAALPAAADTTTPVEYTDMLSLISVTNQKSLTLNDENGALLKTVTLNKSVKTVDDLVKELNNQLAGTGVFAKNNSGVVEFISAKSFAVVDDADSQYILGLNPVPSADTDTPLTFENSLTLISASNPKTLIVTPKDADGNAVAANAITVPVDTPQNSVADLISYLNAQTSLTDAGYTAVDDGKGGVKLTSTTSTNGFSVSGTLLGDAGSGDIAKSTLQQIESAATLTGSYGLNLKDDTDNLSNYLTASVDDATLVNNASILFEVSAVNPDNGTVTLKATSNVLATDGTVKNYVMDNIVLSTGDAAALDLGGKLGLAELDDKGAYKANAFTLKLTDTSAFQSGAKFVFNINKKVDGENARTVQISGTQDPDWPDSWGEEPKDASGKVTGAPLTDAEVRFGIDASQTTSKDLHFRNFYVNSDNGKVYEGDVVLTTGKEVLKDDTALATFTAAYIGKTATADTKLRDLSAFWNSQGVFMLENPQTITITQGDGKTTSITLYATDTLDDMRQKLNSAIGTGLGQAQYATGDTDKFCTFVEKKPGVDMPANGLETVAGTFIFRSLVPGAAGRLTFSGDQDVINAFSMNVVTEPQESSFTASIYDAHTGQAIATNVKVTDNNLIGILHPNVDIEFDPMANITAVWSESQKNFITTSESKPYEAVIHLVDSSTVYQVGANKGEDLALDIGDMTAGSLGITKVNVATREAASRAIGQLDAAINKVSAQRAKIGAYQNSLEYTIENLQTTATNLTAAESRIRDADMAKTMMEFVKLQILNQSGTSMLAQANQLPQQVLSLLQ